MENPEAPQLYENVFVSDVVGKEDFQVITHIENRRMVSSGQCKIILLKNNVQVDEKEVVIKPVSIQSTLFTQNIRSDTEFKIIF